MLSIVYKNIEVGGQLLKKTDTLNQPAIQIKRKPNLLYTLIMSDPDAEPKDFLHWLVVNIDRTNYQDVVPYYPPVPPPRTGVHSYVFHLCEQPKGLRLNPINSRSGFSTGQFILDYHLTVVDKKLFKIKAAT